MTDITTYSCIGWNTKKDADGTFSWIVYGRTDDGRDEMLSQSGGCPSRARATGNARKLVRYYRRLRGEALPLYTVFNAKGEKVTVTIPS